MKTILLSFKPQYFDPIRLGTKKYEYRSRFSDEELKAYVYLSNPEKKVVAIMYLGRRLLLENMKQKYKGELDVVKRIDEYMTVYNKRYAIPIKSVVLINPISLDTIRETLPGFVPPQSYMFVRNSSVLMRVLETADITCDEIVINHNCINGEDICIN